MKIVCELYDGRPFTNNFIARVSWRNGGVEHGIEASVGPLRPADHGASAFTELIKKIDLTDAD